MQSVIELPYVQNASHMDQGIVDNDQEKWSHNSGGFDVGVWFSEWRPLKNKANNYSDNL